MKNDDLIDYVIEKEIVSRKRITINQLSLWYGIPQKKIFEWVNEHSNNFGFNTPGDLFSDSSGHLQILKKRNKVGVK